MPYNLNKISENKYELETEKMKVPAILHVSEDLMPNDDTLQEIEETAASGFLFHHFAALSDVHSKKGRKNPAGTVVVTEKYLLPQINDTAPNCGMRLIKTNLTDETLTPQKINQLFEELVEVIPTKKYVGTKISYKLALEVCKSGTKPLLDHFKFRTKNEIENTFAEGNLFRNKEISNRDILDAIPKLFIHIGKYRLGILGAAGNHFLDLMKISEIKDEKIAEKFGIFPGQYVFLMHTGSGLLGQYASYMYTPKKKEHLSQQIILKLGTMFFGSQMKKIYENIARKIDIFKNSEKFFDYEDGSIEGQMFLTAHKASANFGFANRAILTHHLDQALEKVFGNQIELDLLYDMPHVFVEKENHFGKDVWVHRNNASRAYGPSRMNHPVFSKTGEPAFIPSSMSTPAYLAVGTDKNESTFFSSAHGTGRRKEPAKDKAISKEDLFKKMKAQNVKLYNAKSKGVVLQDSSYYKDVDEVIQGMQDNNIVGVVAKMEPVAVLMY